MMNLIYIFVVEMTFYIYKLLKYLLEHFSKIKEKLYRFLSAIL